MCINAFLSLGKIYEMEMAALHMTSVWLNFKKLTYCFSGWWYHFKFLGAVFENFSWSIFSPTCGCQSFFILNILIHMQMLTHCGLLFILWCKVLFCHVLIFYLNIFFDTVFGQMFDLLKLCTCAFLFVYFGYKLFMRYWSGNIISHLSFQLNFQFS